MRLVRCSGQLITRILAFIPNLFTGSWLAHRLVGASAECVRSSTSPLARGLAATGDGESRLNRSIQEAQ